MMLFMWLRRPLDVQTDTIFEVIPYTGLKYYGLASRYVLSPFPVFLAVVSQLSAGLTSSDHGTYDLPGSISPG